jgi:uncharacterized membrane protein
MSDVPVQLIVAAFQEERAADEAYDQLRAAKWAGVIGIDNAAVIRRDEKNKLHIKERGDPGGGKGAAWGAVVGAALGAIAGPPGVVVGASAGAVVGGITGKYYDSGIPNDRLKKIGEALTPGTSAIVALIEHKWVADMEKEMAEAGAQVMTEALSQDIAEQLAAGNDVSLTAVSAEGAVAVERVATGEDEVDVERIVATDEGVAAVSAVATEEGVAAEGVVVTDEGAASFTATATPEEEEVVEGEIEEEATAAGDGAADDSGVGEDKQAS